MSANGFSIYRGQSQIDGKPIKAIVTGTLRPSQNKKTNDMLQLWILPESSKPSDAISNGDDVSVCGACVHRPIKIAEAKAKATTQAEIDAIAAPCYVEAGKAPNGVWKASYPDHGEAKRKPPIRFGAWGEPTAIPVDIIAGYTEDGHTGYTHRWRECDQRFSQYLMASVDSDAEYDEAIAMGWRTFRVRKWWEPLLPGEMICPASEEGGYRTTCNPCLLCSGTSKKAKNVAIIEH
jgi:hypothetical protein